MFLATGVALAGFIAFTIWDTQNIEKRAASFLEEWSRIKLGDGSERTRLMSKQFGARYSWASQGCNATNCTYSFGFYNIWIYRLHLAPKRVFSGKVVVENDRVVYKELWFIEGKMLQPFVRVHDVDCYPCNAAPKPYDISANGLQFNVTLTPASTSEQRAISNQFNLKVLTSLRRFNPRDFQPALMSYLDRQLKCSEGNSNFLPQCEDTAPGRRP